MIHTGKLDWSQEKVSNLPRLSIGYATEYIKEIDKHPEIYKQKALFLDLVLTLDEREINKLKKEEKAEGHSISVLDFIAKELRTNGTINALKDGSISDFMSSEAKNEGYMSSSDMTNFCHFSRSAFGRRINIDEERKSYEQRYLIEDFMNLGYISKDEGYNIYMNNPITKSRAFDYTFFSYFLDDSDKSKEILNLYNETMKNKINKGEIAPDKWNIPVSVPFLDNVLETGNRDFALQILKDMSKYIPVGTSVKFDSYDERDPFPFLSITQDEKRKKLLEKNNLLEEVEKLCDSYKKRPEAEFYLSNDYRLARVRKSIAAKIDKHLGTNIEEKKLEDIMGNKLGKKVKKVEIDFSRVLDKLRRRTTRE